MASTVGSAVDTVEDRLAMRRLIDEVVLDDDERSLSSTTSALPDPRQAARAVYDAVAGFGLLQRHLDDPDVEEINGRLTVGSVSTTKTRRRLRPGGGRARQSSRLPRLFVPRCASSR